MPSTLVDFHCHLDLYPDFEALVKECDQKGVHTLAVTTTPRAWTRNSELANATLNVKAALGLHPQLVEQMAHEFDLWKTYLPEARYVGEIGLDAGPQFYQSFNLQKQIFGRILKECSFLGEKILTVHSVRAASVVLDMIENHLNLDTCKVVLHWFTGSLKDAQRAIGLGCYFSVNEEMTKKERHQALLKELPLNRILSETDGPFTQCNGRPSRPGDVQQVIHNLARILHHPSPIMENRIFRNLGELNAIKSHDPV